MSDEKSGQNGYAPLWAGVARELEKNDMSANKVAVLETEKIFRKALADRNLPGKSIESKIKDYAYLFSDPDKLRYARAMHRKLLEKIGFDISADDTREIIKGYREAVADLEKINFKGWPVREKIDLFLRRHFYSFPRKSKELFGTLLLASVLTFIITETETGRSLSERLVKANNYFFYRMIPALVLALATGLIALGILYAYQKRKRQERMR